MTPSLTTPAPTAGLGQVRPCPRRPSVNASCMKRWSAAFDSLDFCANWSSRMRKIICVTERAEHGFKVFGFAKVAIDRGEADIGDVVELAQMLHHDLANGFRGNLGLAA